VAAKQKKTKQNTGPSRLSRFRDWLARGDARRRRRAAVNVAWLVLGVLFAGGLIAGMRMLEGRVLRKTYRGERGRAVVRLTGAPSWMPETLHREIVADITPESADLADRLLARKVYDRAAANAWVRGVRQVQVRPHAGRSGGVVEAALEFRRPAACVRNGSTYYYVDLDGVRLPDCQVPMWVVSFHDSRGSLLRQISYLSRNEVPQAWQPAAQRIHYIMMEGVATPAPLAGGPWGAEDLAAGLRLVELIRTKPYYSQITCIDVRNHAARITKNEPELRMYAQIGRGPSTDIRFGRFPAPGGGDYVVSPQRKMSYLDEYAAGNGGRVAGLNSYVDLRFDELHVSIH